MSYNDLIDDNFSDDKNISVQQFETASKGKRFLNFILDNIISRLVLTTIIGVILGFVLAIFKFSFIIYDEITIRIIDFILGIIIVITYYTLTEFKLKGKSIGKFVTNTKVVMLDGSEPDLRTIHIRSWCRLIPFEPFSFLGSSNSGWHDTMSKTKVVDLTKPIKND